MGPYIYVLRIHKAKRYNNKKHFKLIVSVLHSLSIDIIREDRKKDHMRLLIGSAEPLEDKEKMLNFILRSNTPVDEVLLIPIIDRDRSADTYKKPLFDRSDIVGV